MSIIEQKITQQDIDGINVKSTPGSRLHGTVQENKHVFDKLPEFIANRINNLIDAVISSGASEILIKDKDGNLVPLDSIVGNPNDMTVTNDGSIMTVQQFIDDLNGRIEQITADAETERDSDRVTHLNSLHGEVEIADGGNNSIHVDIDPATGRLYLTATAAYQPLHAFTHMPGGTDELSGMLFYKDCRF